MINASYIQTHWQQHPPRQHVPMMRSIPDGHSLRCVAWHVLPKLQVVHKPQSKFTPQLLSRKPMALPTERTHQTDSKSRGEYLCIADATKTPVTAHGRFLKPCDGNKQLARVSMYAGWHGVCLLPTDCLLENPPYSMLLRHADMHGRMRLGWTAHMHTPCVAPAACIEASKKADI